MKVAILAGGVGTRLAEEFVPEPEVFDYIERDATQWELEPMTGLTHDGHLTAYRHTSFWQCMDTPRDKRCLEEL